MVSYLFTISDGVSASDERARDVLTESNKKAFWVSKINCLAICQFSSMSSRLIYKLNNIKM